MIFVLLYIQISTLFARINEIKQEAELVIKLMIEVLKGKRIKKYIYIYMAFADSMSNDLCENPQGG